MSVSQMTQAENEDAPAKGGKKKLVVIVLVVALLGAGVWWQFLRADPAAAEAAPEPGEVVALEAIQVNLAAEHYLRIGIALQLTAEAHEADGSKALDAAIATFSGKPIAEVNDPAKRAELKDGLKEELAHLYHDEVMEVYFTEFVTQ